jgi:predicted acetyltransferase
MNLRLRPLLDDDEAAFLAADRAMAAEGHAFALGYQPGMPWREYLDAQDSYRRGIDVPEHLVAGTFLAAAVDGELVGRASIRYSLGNEFLAREGGHIGYAVIAEHRRKGYATEILRQSLVIARAAGVDRVLLTCDDDNAGSAAVIERCGGRLESLVAASVTGRPMRRYWIA